VALARALVRDPKVFLLDEPLSNLDAVLRENTRGELRELFDRVGATVVYVTHDQVEAMSLSDRIAVMENGRVEQAGTPREIYERPATRFVAGFVGSPRMNFVPGSWAGAEAHTVGIRPEDVQISESEGIEMEVGAREMLGAQQLVHLRKEEIEIRALVTADKNVPDGKLRVLFSPARIHLFDSEGRTTG